MLSTIKCQRLARHPLQILIRSRHDEPIKVVWEKPRIGWTKLNFDGSCKCKAGKSSIGGVLRNHKAEFLLGYAEPIGIADNNVAEFAALQRGLELVLENGWTDVWLEGDSKTLVEVLSKKRSTRCEEVLTRASIISTIIPEFRNCILSHVFREGNRAADRFARMGHRLKRPQIWRHAPPNEVLRIVNEDAAGKIFVRKG